MKKKLLSVLFSAFLTLLLCGSVFAADALVHVNAPDGSIAAGESFTVSVDIRDNPGFTSLAFTLRYNAEDLSCEAAKGGDLLQDMMYVTNPSAASGAIVAGASVEPITGDGELAAFKFTALNDLESPVFSLTDLEIDDENGQAINVKTEIESTEPEPPAEEEFSDLGPNGVDIGTGGYEIDVEEMYAEIAAEQAGEAANAPASQDAPGSNESGGSDQTSGAQGTGQSGAASDADLPGQEASAGNAVDSASDAAVGTGSNTEAQAETGITSEATAPDSGTAQRRSGIIWIILAAILIVAGAGAGLAIRRKNR